MRIEVEAPDGEVCNGCDCLSQNFIEVSNGLPKIHVYCRKLKVVWESESKEIKKHHDCPTNLIEVIENGKSKSVHRAISTGATKEDTTVKQTKVLW